MATIYLRLSLSFMTGTLRGVRFARGRTPTDLAPSIDAAVARPWSDQMVLLLEMDDYTGPPLTNVYTDLSDLPHGTNVAKLIALPMSTRGKAQPTRMQVQTPLGTITALRLQAPVSPARAQTLHVTQGINARPGMVMAPADGGRENYDGALNYVGISRPPNERKLYPLKIPFKPAMFQQRPGERALVVDEYTRLRQLHGQPASSTLASLEPPAAMHAVVL
jgi:hypothetical protein